MPKLWFFRRSIPHIGVTDRAGGMTDAEAGLQRLADYLQTQHGSNVSFAVFEQPDERRAARDRSDSERRQADTIVAELDRMGAARAIMLVPKSEASIMQFVSASERFSGYAPMAMYLPMDDVLNFQVTRSSDAEATNIALHMFPEPIDGFAGELALSRLTHPGLPPIVRGQTAKLTEDGQWVIPVAEPAIDKSAEAKARREAAADITRRVRILADGGEDGLPEFWWED